MKNSLKTIPSFLLVLLLSMTVLAGCGSDNDKNNNGKGNGNTTGAKAGTYTASAQGYKSNVSVTVTIAEDGTISDIKVDASGETPDLGGKAAPTICNSVLENQSLAVDTVSGATITSKATLAALEDALTQAGADVDALKNKTIANNDFIAH